MTGHTFHIPVMGIGFTIDTPLRVAPYGISSVISLVDDILIEKMRKFHSEQLNIPYQAISSKMEDFRAKRITAFLDLMDKAIKEKLEEIREGWNKKGSELEKYFDMLPNCSELKKRFDQICEEYSADGVREWLKQHLQPGSIDVNIMTKLDRDTYKSGQQQPVMYNDAHSALRGFANSTVESSIILSAGMNPRLYSYLEEFECFYPNDNHQLHKKIVLKVSDYRSALIQGRFLAKKGLWVSEYRIESGLNCGGHAFATQGHLMGPILEEFKQNRQSLIDDMFTLFKPALIAKGRTYPNEAPELKITAQGGVGTAEEHNFLLENYNLDSIGWGSPFLLVPEVSNIDEPTLELLEKADEKDLYLSNISPLGVPFNTIKGNTKDIEKFKHIAQGKPGSACPKRYACLNNEFEGDALCTASRQYQRKKIEQIKNEDLTQEEFSKQFEQIIEKSCICVGLGTSALIVNNLSTKVEGTGVSICPGPNIAWFSQRASLKEMADHIYGRINLMTKPERPNMFISELKMYVKNLEEKIKDSASTAGKNQTENFSKFKDNLKAGIEYYKNLAANLNNKKSPFDKERFVSALHTIETRLQNLSISLKD